MRKSFLDHASTIMTVLNTMLAIAALICVVLLVVIGFAEETAEKRTDFDTAMIIDAGIYKTDIVWYTIEGEWVTICTKTEPFDEITYRIHQSNVVLIRQEVAP